ncbi:hypothetical protein HK405_008712, partial [Cladochytrium tenue]
RTSAAESVVALAGLMEGLEVADTAKSRPQAVGAVELGPDERSRVALRQTREPRVKTLDLDEVTHLDALKQAALAAAQAELLARSSTFDRTTLRDSGSVLRTGSYKVDGGSNNDGDYSEDEDSDDDEDDEDDDDDDDVGDLVLEKVEPDRWFRGL